MARQPRFTGDKISLESIVDFAELGISPPPAVAKQPKRPSSKSHQGARNLSNKFKAKSRARRVLKQGEALVRVVQVT